MSMRDEIARHLDRLDDVIQAEGSMEVFKGNWVIAALELLLRAELARHDAGKPRT